MDSPADESPSLVPPLARSGFDGLEMHAPTDWQKFERLCRDLWAAIWSDPNAQLNGRSGQPQAGVDVTGQPEGAVRPSGIQCKQKDNICDSAQITEAVLRAEVEKAKSFKPPLREFILASTAPRDAKIQEVARRISDEHAAVGLFSVVVYSWHDIQERLGSHTEVWYQHFPGVVNTVRAIDALTVERERAIGGQATITAASIASSTTASASSAIASSSTAFTLPLDAEHRAEIEMVRDLLKDGHGDAAMKAAERLSNRIWHSASTITRARLRVLIGHIHVDLGAPDAASTALIEAASHAPSDASIQAQVAFGHSIAGNVAAARTWGRRALDQDPTNIVAIQVCTVHDDRPDDVIVEEHEAILGPRAELYAALGQRAAIKDDFDASRVWLEKSLALDAGTPGVKAIAAEVTINSIGRSLPSVVGPSRAQQEKIQWALRLVDEAIGTLQSDGARRAHEDWYATRIVGNRLLDSPDLLTIADSALVTCGRTPQLVRLTAMIANEKGEHGKAIALLEGLGHPLDEDTTGLLAAAYGNVGDFQRSAAMWKALLEQPGLSDEHLHDARLNYVLTLQAIRSDDALAIINALIANNPDTLSPVVLAMQAAERRGDLANRDRFIAEALALASHGPAYLQLRLADALSRAELWAEAAEIYALVVKPGSADIYGRLLVQSLYNAGRYASALKACNEAEEADGPSRFIAEIRSLMHEELGDLKAAETACRNYLTNDANNVPVILRLAHVLQRAQQDRAAADLLARITLNDVTSVETAVPLSQMLIRVDRANDAQELLYRIRRDNLNQLEAHVAFIGVFNKVGRHEEFLSEVTTGCAVELTGDGAPGWILLHDAEDADIAQREYAPSHSLAMRLVGRKSGDFVSVSGVASQWRVARIGSKYGFAFSRTMEMFPTNFPDSNALELHKVSDEPGEFLTDLKAKLQPVSQQEARALEQYVAGRCTVGSIAAALGRPVFNAISLAIGAETGFQCADNTVGERASAATVLLSIPTLLLDVTAIVTLEGLGILRGSLFGERALAVTQTTLDVFSNELARWQSTHDAGGLSIGMEGENVVRFQTTPEDVQRMRVYYSALVDWLRRQTDVVAVPPNAAEEMARHGRVRDLIGASFWDSLCVAKAAPDTVLVSDDLRLRQLAKTMLNIESVCSPHVLLSALDQGVLSAVDYATAISKLIASNYRSLPVNALVLDAAARADQWRPGRTFQKAVNGLRGPDTVMEGAADVAAEFIHLVGLNVVLSEQRSTLFMAVLDAVTAGRRVEPVLGRLVARLKGHQHLLPVHHEETMRVITAWQTIKMVPLVQ